MEFREVRIFSNLVDLFLWRASVSGAKPALCFKKNNKYNPITWKEFSDSVRHVALGLYTLGVRHGDRVGILSENRPEWAYADLGILSLGAASVPIYPTSSVKECHYILEHAETKILFVSTHEQLKKVGPLLNSKKLTSVIMFDPLINGNEGVLSFQDLLETGRLCNLNNEHLYDQQVNTVTREDIATVIYTSGTTGPPKGVMLTHGNFLSNCEASREVLPIKEDERSLSFLPLSHVFERMAGYYYMIQSGVSIAYAENMQTVPEDLLLARPTVAASVPRLFEKIHSRILEAVEAGSPSKKKLFYWAIKVGRQSGLYRQTQKPLPLGLAFSLCIARVLVFNKLKKKLGGRIHFFISGGAPLAKDLAEFFYAADVLILEGYGLTETSPVISVNRLKKFKFGTVGLPLPGVEVRINPDGEILSCGPHIMKGYFQNEAATREAIREGWFYTGDIGELDQEGFLSITGRKKDLIITAGGKNISPQNIENEILSDSLFSQVMIIGDRKPYLVALIVPNRAELERLVAQCGIPLGSWESLIQDEKVVAEIKKRLDLKTKDFAPYEQIKYIHLLPNELCQEKGELTPTLKVKRQIVMERYGREINALYDQGEAHKLLPHAH